MICYCFSADPPTLLLPMYSCQPTRSLCTCNLANQGSFQFLPERKITPPLPCIGSAISVYIALAIFAIKSHNHHTILSYLLLSSPFNSHPSLSPWSLQPSTSDDLLFSLFRTQFHSMSDSPYHPSFLPCAKNEPHSSNIPPTSLRSAIREITYHPYSTLYWPESRMFSPSFLYALSLSLSHLISSTILTLSALETRIGHCIV
jgi:hypothetical protein